MKKKLYQAIAGAVLALETQTLRGADGSNWRLRADTLARHFLPSGSGIDCGTKIDWARTSSARLVFLAPFHHMNENGMYDGWTDHSIIVTAGLALELNIRVTGRNRNNIKDYLAETYQYALTRDGEETAAAAHGWREEEEAPAAEKCVRCQGSGRDPGYTPLPNGACVHCQAPAAAGDIAPASTTAAAPCCGHYPAEHDDKGCWNGAGHGNRCACRENVDA